MLKKKLLLCVNTGPRDFSKWNNPKSRLVKRVECWIRFEHRCCFGNSFLLVTFIGEVWFKGFGRFPSGVSKPRKDKKLGNSGVTLAAKKSKRSHLTTKKKTNRKWLILKAFPNLVSWI